MANRGGFVTGHSGLGHVAVTTKNPHQVRGYLADFTTLTVSNYAFEQCTACSPSVIEAYEKEGHDMICAACNDSDYLEHVSHLDELKRKTDALELELDWSDEEAEGIQ